MKTKDFDKQEKARFKQYGMDFAKLYEKEFYKLNPLTPEGLLKKRLVKVDLKKLKWDSIKIPKTEYTIKPKIQKKSNAFS